MGLGHRLVDDRPVDHVDALRPGRGRPAPPAASPGWRCSARRARWRWPARGSRCAAPRRACWPRSRRRDPCTSNVGCECVVGRVDSKQPPWSTAMSTSTEPCRICSTSASRHEAGRPRPDDEHGADHDVGLEADLLDGVLRRGDRLERAAEVVVHLAQAVEVAVEDEDLRVHADRHGGGGEAGHAGTEDHDPGAAHARARPQTSTPRPPPGRMRWWAPISGAIRPATSLMGASSGSVLSSWRTVS